VVHVRASFKRSIEGTTIGTLEDRIQGFHRAGTTNPLTAQPSAGGPAHRLPGRRCRAKRHALAPSRNVPTVWHEFARASTGSKRRELHRSNTAAQGRRATISQSDSQAVERDELGSGFTLSNGGNVQISTKGSSGAVSNSYARYSANVLCINLTVALFAWCHSKISCRPTQLNKDAVSTFGEGRGRGQAVRVGPSFTTYAGDRERRRRMLAAIIPVERTMRCLSMVLLAREPERALR